MGWVVDILVGIAKTFAFVCVHVFLEYIRYRVSFLCLYKNSYSDLKWIIWSIIKISKIIRNFVCFICKY